MPSHARCAVGFCDNDKRYPELVYVRSHVQKLTYHKLPDDPKLSDKWHKQAAKTQGDVFNPPPGASRTFVCSNHFPLGRRTLETLKLTFHRFLTVSDCLQKRSPKKRKANKLQVAGASRYLPFSSSSKEDSESSSDDNEDLETEVDYFASVPAQFEQLTRELEVKV